MLSSALIAMSTASTSTVNLPTLSLSDFLLFSVSVDFWRDLIWMVVVVHNLFCLLRLGEKRCNYDLIFTATALLVLGVEKSMICFRQTMNRYMGIYVSVFVLHWRALLECPLVLQKKFCCDFQSECKRTNFFLFFFWFRFGYSFDSWVEIQVSLVQGNYNVLWCCIIFAVSL